jgi:hypothetical protein
VATVSTTDCEVVSPIGIENKSQFMQMMALADAVVVVKENRQNIF